jgi:hypothetical protein
LSARETTAKILGALLGMAFLYYYFPISLPQAKEF